MPSLLPGFEYDIFISYRQKDNKYDGWVTEFISNLRKELEATFKEDVSIYFDANPFDGLLETHQVDKSLEGKLKCLIFIPIISQTYCDPKSFAWQQEFCAFNRMAKADAIGMNVEVSHGNVSSRILPIKIHDLDAGDKAMLELELGGVLRAIDFIYKEPGVNRPLKPDDKKSEGLNKTDYRNQVNKAANAIKEILTAIMYPLVGPATARPAKAHQEETILSTAMTRGLPRVAVVYAIFSFLLVRLSVPLFKWLGWTVSTAATASVFGAGLLVALLLAWYFEFSPSGIIRTSSEAARANPYSPTRKKPLTGNVFLGILLVLLIAEFALSGSTNKPGKVNSIAVLYFDNLSSESGQESFSDGITEEITAHLSRIRDLRVTSRTSVLQYKGKGNAANIRQIAEELNVENILEGSVRKSGNKLRITAQLINARTDEHIWSEVFDRDSTDIFDVQSEIAQAIAARFKVAISPEAIIRMKAVPTENLQAYELFLKARSMPGITGFGIGTHYGSVYKRISLLQQAIAMDPNFAEAYVLLSRAYLELENKADSSAAMAKEAIIRDPSLPEAYIVLSLTQEDYRTWAMKAYALDTAAGLRNFGIIHSFQGRQESAVHAFAESFRMRPNDYRPLAHAYWAYSTMGQMDSAKLFIDRAKALDPLAREVLEAETNYHQFRAEPELMRVPALKYFGTDSLGYYKVMAIAYLYAHRWKEAEAWYAKTNYRDMDVGLVMYKTGRPDSGRKVLLNSLAYRKERSSWPGDLARIHALLGNKKEALENYRKVLLTRGYVQFFKIDPFTDYIRDDPDFKEIMEEAEALLKKKLEYIREHAGKPFDLDRDSKNIPSERDIRIRR